MLNVARSRPAPEPSAWRFPRDFDPRALTTVPGMLSLSRVAFAALFPLTIGRPAWSLAVLAAAGASDVLDGWWARRFHRASATGAMLDGVTDKVFFVAVVVTLLVSKTLNVVEVLLIATRDIGELALAARMAVGRQKQKLTAAHAANVGGKVATLLQYVAVVAVILGAEGELRAAVIGAAALAGVVAGAVYWAREERRSLKAAAAR